jgi:hypothetical protein
MVVVEVGSETGLVVEVGRGSGRGVCQYDMVSYGTVIRVRCESTMEWAIFLT